MSVSCWQVTLHGISILLRICVDVLEAFFYPLAVFLNFSLSIL